jgi:hypothetical protein
MVLNSPPRETAVDDDLRYIHRAVAGAATTEGG